MTAVVPRVVVITRETEYERLLATHATRGQAAFFLSSRGQSIDELEVPADPVLCIGPEGGFAQDEVPDGALTLSLGPTILRVETAAIVGAAVLSCQ